MNTDVKETIARELEDASNEDDIIAIFQGIEAGFSAVGLEERDLARAVFKLSGVMGCSLEMAVRAIAAASDLAKPKSLNTVAIDMSKATINNPAQRYSAPKRGPFTAKAARAPGKSP